MWMLIILPINKKNDNFFVKVSCCVMCWKRKKRNEDLRRVMFVSSAALYLQTSQLQGPESGTDTKYRHYLRPCGTPGTQTLRPEAS
jgi:hypothetical protein